MASSRKLQYKPAHLARTFTVRPLLRAPIIGQSILHGTMTVLRSTGHDDRWSSPPPSCIKPVDTLEFSFCQHRTFRVPTIRYCLTDDLSLLVNIKAKAACSSTYLVDVFVLRPFFPPLVLSHGSCFASSFSLSPVVALSPSGWYLDSFSLGPSHPCGVSLTSQSWQLRGWCMAFVPLFEQG